MYLKPIFILVSLYFLKEMRQKGEINIRIFWLLSPKVLLISSTEAHGYETMSFVDWR